MIEVRNSDGWQKLPDDWPEVIRRVFAARGVYSESDLQFDLAELPSPDLLKGMPAACALLQKAIESDWSVLIVGDFDADGATSTAVLMRGLKQFGLTKLSFLVPNRFIHGYGLTPVLLDELSSENTPNLLITVDNGIASIDGVHAAKQRGMHVLITDHHLPGEDLPDADAILNPNQQGDAFPSKALAGVGVAFYLLLGLRNFLHQQGWFSARQLTPPRLIELLDLVALGTVADVVPLDKLNRSLVMRGLARMRQGKACAGIQALLTISGKDRQRLSAQDLGFAIGPRLNAAGRMEDMGQGIEVLLTDDRFFAEQSARLLDDINLQRRDVEQEMQQQALKMLDHIALPDAEQLPIITLYQADWHQGVIGLLASRIKERLHRPVIVFAEGEPGELKGSARSISGIHIRDVLAHVDSQVPGLINKFGGHAMAAGLTIDKANFDDFQKALHHSIERFVDEDTFTQKRFSDGALAITDMNLDLAARLPVLAPWGQLFAEPQFHGEFELIDFRHVGQQQDHLKMTIRLVDGRVVTAMAFKQTAPFWMTINQKVMLLYRLDINEFRQQQSLQLLVDTVWPVDS
ncbi:single-stranded-DNA-specific exonuclease RecJ [Methylophaga sp. OBS3]|uniref:single-stranded-DNA-specific exonuclease RecJ n=1 Tax=Methylophaga sp. OBS3 TaxID=2991934 RepID=UPI002253F90B|nr:single-stranded-DNA-specific exonuclease RecJ [Methylophaga sp. OBS3]MCX4189295.1 single-stranded-DNA-specific exonuclease RecJ [Methylophaga sp. OBS3]